jgi:hypothetical protein
MRYHITFDDTSAATRANGDTVQEKIENALHGIGPGNLPLTNGTFMRSIGLAGNTKPITSAASLYGTAAQYLNSEDKLVVALLDSAGGLHRFGIGAPVLAAFLADQETGNGAQLVDFVAAMTTAVTSAFACTRTGLPFVGAVGSVLVRRRQRRKTTLISKSSNLDEPGE